ncbi:MAG: HTH-type transcriptional activator IlvY [Arenicella sp.]
MLDNKTLRYFLTLSETLHFSKASQILHVSPSTLSRSIRQLESQLQCHLFLRDNRTVELTADGILFLQYARDSIQQWEQLRESLSLGRQELRGIISLYCSVTASYSFLHEVLQKFRFDFPGIEIVLHTGDTEDAIDRVLNNQEDIAIAAKPRRMPAGLAFETLGETPLVLIAPKDADFQKKFPTIDKTDKNFWEKVPMILPEKGVFREQIDHWLNKESFSPNIYAQIGGNEAIVSMVSLGFGIAWVPLIVVENSPLANQVQLISGQPQFQSIAVGFCARNKRLQSPLVKALWNSII